MPEHVKFTGLLSCPRRNVPFRATKLNDETEENPQSWSSFSKAGYESELSRPAILDSNTFRERAKQQRIALADLDL